MQTQTEFPQPTRGASLLLSFRLNSRTVVIVGSGSNAASRAFSFLEAQARVVVLGWGGPESACEELKWRFGQGQIEWVAIEEEAMRWYTGPGANSVTHMEEEEAALHSVLSRLPLVSFVCITDTILTPDDASSLPPRSRASAYRLYDIANHIYHIPTNTTDMPSLCDFAFPAAHHLRSEENDGSVEKLNAKMIGGSTQTVRNAIPSVPTLHPLPPMVPLPSNTRRGRILLLGSGPGHPSLLTHATSSALRSADLVLSDKLVPEDVLREIPKHVELRIARKFPGTGDKAQEELMHAALEAARQGKVVVRLKQGDPMLYARASSEIMYFTEHGFPPAVVPGLSSALAAPLAAGIPVTARGVADSVVICTGVGRGGKRGRVSPFERGTTVLVLMSVARLAEIVQGMAGAGYPDYLPTCIVERGTMPDQRVILSTLGGIVEAMSHPKVGPQRPPGMMVVGWACLGVAEGVEGVSDDSGEGLRHRDLERVNKWLGGEPFVIREGLDESWHGL